MAVAAAWGGPVVGGVGLLKEKSRARCRTAFYKISMSGESFQWEGWPLSKVLAYPKPFNSVQTAFFKYWAELRRPKALVKPTYARDRSN